MARRYNGTDEVLADGGAKSYNDMDSIATSYNNIATILLKLGRNAEAEKYLEKLQN